MTNEEFLMILKNQVGEKITAISFYNYKKVIFKCGICGHIWSAYPRRIIKRQTGCPICSINKKKIQYFKERVASINRDWENTLKSEFQKLEFINGD